MKWACLLFGLNYKHIPSATLNGCINDTILMKNTLTSLLGPGYVEMYHDDRDLENTSYDGIMNAIFRMSLRAIKEKYELVVIHYSGHGSQVKDTSGDEDDGLDEVICPSDFLTMGQIKDDIIAYLLEGFPAFTRVITIFDSCHSGTVTDLPFKWKSNVCTRVNHNRMPAKIISISGCTDSQVSLDTGKGGLLTTNIVKILSDPNKCMKTRLNVFQFMQTLNEYLECSGGDQRSVLMSSYDLRSDPILLPLSQSSQSKLLEMEAHPRCLDQDCLEYDTSLRAFW